MEKPNILNTLNILQKVEIGENTTILFYFGDIPAWTKNEFVHEIGDPADFYEVFEINFNLNHADVVSLYWKIRRYAGEKVLIAFNENKMNIWSGEIHQYEEEWSFFDDLDDEILIFNFSKYNVLKSVQDWKNDYMKLEEILFVIRRKKLE